MIYSFCPAQAALGCEVARLPGQRACIGLLSHRRYHRRAQTHASNPRGAAPARVLPSSCHLPPRIRHFPARAPSPGARICACGSPAWYCLAGRVPCTHRRGPIDACGAAVAQAQGWRGACRNRWRRTDSRPSRMLCEPDSHFPQTPIHPAFTILCYAKLPSLLYPTLSQLSQFGDFTPASFPCYDVGGSGTKCSRIPTDAHVEPCSTAHSAPLVGRLRYSAPQQAVRCGRPLPARVVAGPHRQRPSFSRTCGQALLHSSAAGLTAIHRLPPMRAGDAPARGVCPLDVPLRASFRRRCCRAGRRAHALPALDRLRRRQAAASTVSLPPAAPPSALYRAARDADVRRPLHLYPG